MLTFYEYLARVQTVLADPAKMMAKMGISKDVPHPIEIQRLVKAQKKADAQAPKTQGAMGGVGSQGRWGWGRA